MNKTLCDFATNTLEGNISKSLLLCCFLTGLSEESSDDEPLINLVKRNHTDKQTKTKTKASAPKKRGTTPKKPRKTLVSGKDSGKGYTN